MFTLSQKTMIWQAVAIIIASIALSACADVRTPMWLTGEPDEETTGAASNRAGIQRIDQGVAEWPNLATVPNRPTNVMSDKQRAAIIARMKRENEMATQLQGTQP